MNRNHTHTGNCQACGREHAIDISKGDIAKHGYTVDWGGFLGVCSGADRLPAQKDVTYTNDMIAMCKREAARLEAMAGRLEVGSEDPTTCVHYDATLEWTNKYGTKRTGKNVEVPYAKGTGVEQRTARVNLINECKHRAEGNRSHAAFLKSYVLPMFGTELHSVEQAETRKAAERAEREAKPTKASFKRQLERIGRDYDKARRVIHDLLLAGNRDERSEAWELAYDMPYSLCHFRPKHAKAIVAALGESVQIQVVEIELMVEARERVVKAQKAAGL